MSSRSALLLIAAIFIISPVTAWLFHSGIINLGDEQRESKNRGELVHPARPLEGFELLDDNGEIITQENFLGLWTLLEFAVSPCNEDCMKNVYKMRQIRLALGKDAHRVQRAIVAETSTDMDKLMLDNPGTRLFRTTDKSAKLVATFPGYIHGDISSIAGRIYIVDPLGNLMMKYQQNADPSDVLKDLRQLLKATWIRPRT
jgi:cytochrome oxidase Cu insertion factor (SCO1/SenC/PrrC family)